MLKKCWKLYDTLENEWTKYNIMNGEESYHLGVEDGMQIASEREIWAKGSVLSFQDMTHLIYTVWAELIYMRGLAGKN